KGYKGTVHPCLIVGIFTDILHSQGGQIPANYPVASRLCDILSHHALLCKRPQSHTSPFLRATHARLPPHLCPHTNPLSPSQHLHHPPSRLLPPQRPPPHALQPTPHPLAAHPHPSHRRHRHPTRRLPPYPPPPLRLHPRQDS